MDYYFTTLELSLMLQSSVDKIRKLIKDKKLRAYKIGRNYVIAERDLNNYLNSVSSYEK